MRVFIAGVSSERQYVKAIESFYELKVREGDEKAHLFSGTGLNNRMDLCDVFLDRKEFDAILLVDMDMLLPEDGLERLRAHDLDMVAGHYFKHTTSPMMSVCAEEREGRTWPIVDIPDGLIPITFTGMGFVLIKREVVEAVANIPGIGHPFASGTIPEISDDKIIGQDIRFFWYAQTLGYKLWLDGGVECLHGVTVWLSKYLYNILKPHQDEEWERIRQEVRELHQWQIGPNTFKESKSLKNLGMP